MHALITIAGGGSAAGGAAALATGLVLCALSQPIATPVAIAGGLGLAFGIPALIMGLHLWAEHERAKEAQL